MSSELDSLSAKWRHMPAGDKLAALGDMPHDIQAIVASKWQFLARPSQYYPDTEEDWFVWLFTGGYGAGKSWTGSNFLIDCLKKGYKRPALVGQTSNDVKSTMVEGPSGILVMCEREGIEANYVPSQRRIYFPKLGADVYAITYSADTPDQFKGPEHDCIWMDEQCKWTYPEAYEILLTRARMGPKPRIFSSTTPERSPILDNQIPHMINAQVEGSEVIVYDHRVNPNPDAFIWVSQSKTSENATLGAREQNVWSSMYGSTRNKEWALEGRILLDVPDALWSAQMIDKARMDVPRHHRTEELIQELEIETIVVAIDPAVTTGDNSDESGIVVFGRDCHGHGYVLEDCSGKLSPVDACTVAVNLYKKWGADYIVYERNQGGDFVKETLRMVDNRIPLRDVWASKGKRTRAEPIVALYEQGKIHHVGPFDLLENQMMAFTPDNRVIKSPDRVDALVWGATQLMLGSTWDGTITWV